MEQRFAKLDDYTPVEQLEARTRAFEGDGSPFLPVPGLKRLDAIRVGHMELPLAEPRRYPVTAHGEFQNVEEPLVATQHRSDGVPVLVRAVISNDGLWPHGVTVFVRGEWENGEAPAAPAPSAGLLQQEVDRLHRQVADMGVAPAPDVHTLSADAQLAAAATDAEVRTKVALETGRVDAFDNEGGAPTLVPPIGVAGRRSK